MKFSTQILRLVDIDREKYKKDIRKAADLLRCGQVVAFPTETVYGLGAHALNKEAIKRIFLAKGRPSDNPLIVHIAHRRELMPLVSFIPAWAIPLMEAFWPGPLTLIFPKSDRVPDVTTGDLATVAIRMPLHPMALDLIDCCGFPLAAPSANLSGHPSPTTAEHVWHDMEGRIPLILDGGKAKIGLESTVLDLTGEVPIILRPGGVTQEMLQDVIPEVQIDPGAGQPLEDGRKVRSPGMKYRHYAPLAKVLILSGALNKVIDKILCLYDGYTALGKKVGIMATGETWSYYGDRNSKVVGLRSDPATIAAGLFDCLRQFDHDGMDIILAEAIPTCDIGMAIMNRLGRAAGFDIWEV